MQLKGACWARSWLLLPRAQPARRRARRNRRYCRRRRRSATAARAALCLQAALPQRRRRELWERMVWTRHMASMELSSMYSVGGGALICTTRWTMATHMIGHVHHGPLHTIACGYFRRKLQMVAHGVHGPRQLRAEISTCNCMQWPMYMAIDDGPLGAAYQRLLVLQKSCSRSGQSLRLSLH